MVADNRPVTRVASTGTGRYESISLLCRALSTSNSCMAFALSQVTVIWKIRTNASWMVTTFFALTVFKDITDRFLILV